MHSFEEYGSDEPRFGWAVGLFDGEGSIGIYRNYPMLRLSMTDAETVRMFHGVVGVGSLHWSYRRDHRKPCLSWALYRKDVIQDLLLRFLPLLVTKRKSALITLRFLKWHRSAYKRERLLKELKTTTVRGRRF